MKKFNFLFFLMCFSICFSQNKNEKETLIGLDKLPEKAKQHFKTPSYNIKRLKFYKETDNSKQSFEAKLKVNKLHYSIEFDTIGNLEDIEIIVKEKHVTVAVMNTIKSYFNLNFEQTKIIKIQKQYTNYTKNSDSLFIQHIIKNPNKPHNQFEIIAEIKTNKKHELREFTFDRNGAFKKFRIVTPSSYDHALY